MKIRLILAAVCMLGLPLLFSTPGTNHQVKPAPFSGVALAGRTIADGYYCTCGTQDCICDPGETPINRQSAPPVTTSDSKRVKHNPDPQVDLTPGALLGALVLLLWLRMR